jgi:hypothetical protein
MRLFFIGPRFFGIRPGISVRPDEIFGRTKRAASAPSTMTGSFLYVFKGDHNLVKVGVSTNPDARLAQLRTASPFPIDYAYVGVTPGNGFDIEGVAHDILASHRCNGEWFDVKPEMAVAALAAASHRLNQPLAQLQPEMVAEILRIGAIQDAAAANDQPRSRTLAKAAWLLWAFVFIIAAMVGVLAVLARYFPTQTP